MEVSSELAPYVSRACTILASVKPPYHIMCNTVNYNTARFVKQNIITTTIIKNNIQLVYIQRAKTLKKGNA